MSWSYQPILPGGAQLQSGATTYRITADAGSYTYSGQSATITRSRIISAASGSYTYTGQNATFTRSRLLTASPGSYVYTGQTATLLRSRLVTAAAGSYVYTGQTATLLRSRLVTAAAGSYVYTGQDTTITYTPNSAKYTITADAGSYSISGQDATITYTGILPAAVNPFAKWTPFKLACRYSVLQRGSLNVGNTQQNIANLLALARAEADSPSSPPWARWRTAVNSPHITSNLMINVPRVPGFVPHGGYFGRMWDWIVRYLKGVA